MRVDFTLHAQKACNGPAILECRGCQNIANNRIRWKFQKVREMGIVGKIGARLSHCSWISASVNARSRIFIALLNACLLACIAEAILKVKILLCYKGQRRMVVCYVVSFSWSANTGYLQNTNKGNHIEDVLHERSEIEANILWDHLNTMKNEHPERAIRIWIFELTCYSCTGGEFS